ncbi:MAG TPA: hypothetical protein DCE41_33860 [Cytophagales bacterium]|nr:hypothetical protein [Cytophagales bacterium]HAA17981.1 hypothetical protein [Cytophagales bacterium]HAP64726.1 hypothetical protein [Cytophagales bacterium]
MFYTLDTNPWPVYVTTIHPHITVASIDSFFEELGRALTQHEGKFIPILILPKAYLKAEARMHFGKQWGAFYRKHAARHGTTLVVAESPMAEMMLKGILLATDEKVKYQTFTSLEEAKEQALRWVKIYHNIANRQILSA